MSSLRSFGSDSRSGLTDEGSSIANNNTPQNDKSRQSDCKNDDFQCGSSKKDDDFQSGYSKKVEDFQSSYTKKNVDSFTVPYLRMAQDLDNHQYTSSSDSYPTDSSVQEDNNPNTEVLYKEEDSESYFHVSTRKENESNLKTNTSNSSTLDDLLLNENVSDTVPKIPHGEHSIGSEISYSEFDFSTRSISSKYTNTREQGSESSTSHSLLPKENDPNTVPKVLYREQSSESDHSTFESGFGSGSSRTTNTTESWSGSSTAHGSETRPKMLYDDQPTKSLVTTCKNSGVSNKVSRNESNSTRTDSFSTEQNTQPKVVIEISNIATISISDPTVCDSETTPLVGEIENKISFVSSNETLNVHVVTYKTSNPSIIVCSIPILERNGENDSSFCDSRALLCDCARQCEILPLYFPMYGLWKNTANSWLLLTEPFVPDKREKIEFRIRYTVDASTDEKRACRVEEIGSTKQSYSAIDNNVLKYLFFQRRHDFLKNFPFKNSIDDKLLKQHRPELCQDKPNLKGDEVLIPSLFDFLRLKLEVKHKEFYKNPLKLLPDSSIHALNSSGILSILTKYFLKKRFHQLLNSFQDAADCASNHFSKPVEFYYQKYISYLRKLEPRFHTELFLLAEEIGIISVDGDDGITIATNDLKSILKNNYNDNDTDIDIENLTSILKNDSDVNNVRGLKLLQTSEEDTKEVIKLKLDFNDIGDMHLMIEGDIIKVFLSDILGRQMVLSFPSEKDGKSFVECVAGYSKLLVDYYSDLSAPVCEKSKLVYGPVRNTFLRHKLESNPSKYACAYRESTKTFGEYELMVKIPKDGHGEYTYQSIGITKDKDGALGLDSYQQFKFIKINDVINSLRSDTYKEYFSQDETKALKNIVRPDYRDTSCLVIQRAAQLNEDVQETPQMPEISELGNVKSIIAFPPGFNGMMSIREYKVQKNTKENAKTRLVLIASLYQVGDLSIKQHNLESLGESLKNLFIARHHCHVIRQLGVTISHEKIFEYSEHGDLISYLTGTSRTNRENIQITGEWLIQIFYQLAHALSYFESKKIAHGAISAKNIILIQNSPNPFIKLFHAGVRSYFAAGIPAKEVPTLTPPWIAKEFRTFENNPNPAKTPTINGDKWSFATTVCEIDSIARKNKPLEEKDTACMMPIYMEKRYNCGDIMKVVPCWLDSDQVKFSKFLRQCWCTDPGQRPPFLTLLRIITKLLHNGTGNREKYDLLKKMENQNDDTDFTKYNDSDLEFIKQLGKGNYGKVDLCQHRKTKERFAVKEMHEIANSRSCYDFSREIYTMRFVKHENIMPVKGIAVPSFRIVLDHLPLKSLDCFLEDKKSKITNQIRIDFAQQIARGMIELRRKNIVHRDLALRNVLVKKKEDGSYIAKISDFGLARHVALNSNSYTDTHASSFPIRWYAPECLADTEVETRFESEVWSYGITLCELFGGLIPPIFISNLTQEHQLLQQIRKKLYPKKPINCYRKIYENVIAECCKENPSDRISFQDAIDRLEREKEIK